MTNPTLKTYTIPSAFGGFMSVDWKLKVLHLLGGNTHDHYYNICTSRQSLATARAEINFLRSEYETRLARIREADSIVREIEDYNNANND